MRRPAGSSSSSSRAKAMVRFPMSSTRSASLPQSMPLQVQSIDTESSAWYIPGGAEISVGQRSHCGAAVATAPLLTTPSSLRPDVTLAVAAAASVDVIWALASALVTVSCQSRHLAEHRPFDDISLTTAARITAALVLSRGPAQDGDLVAENSCAYSGSLSGKSSLHAQSKKPWATSLASSASSRTELPFVRASCIAFVKVGLSAVQKTGLSVTAALHVSMVKSIDARPPPLKPPMPERACVLRP
mmetsp:Transcript_11005/g.32374  ORF Transcript_11005/g.32374 Transcript_11005/m.32374 type:complete len:245 (+) Transcript_11005:2184-2918(+)